MCIVQLYKFDAPCLHCHSQFPCLPSLRECSLESLWFEGVRQQRTLISLNLISVSVSAFGPDFLFVAMSTSASMDIPNIQLPCHPALEEFGTQLESPADKEEYEVRRGNVETAAEKTTRIARLQEEKELKRAAAASRKLTRDRYHRDLEARCRAR
jgi:hypothetical protein